MEENISAKVHEAADKAVKKLQDGSKTVIGILDVEKQKAEIKAEIGHCNKDLSRAYESLGRIYFNQKVEGIPMEAEADIIDLIRSKEKIIELLNEKLDNLEN